MNNLDGLKKTYKSIHNQSFTDFEWVVIDGKSTDKTASFLETIKAERADKKVPQPPEFYAFRYYSEPDDGIYDAMNIGLSKIRGDYVLFLNAGDMLADDKILTLLAEVSTSKPDFIYGDALESVSVKKNNSPESRRYKVAKRYKSIVWGMFTHHQSMIYRRHTIRDLGIHYSHLYKIASDYDFTVRFLLGAKSMKYINKPICIFEPGGVSQQNAFKGRREQFLIREKMSMVSQAMNVWIFIVQSLAWFVRTKMPPLYRLLKVVRA